MPAKGFSGSLRHHDGTTIIDLYGDINASAEYDLDALYQQAEGQNTSVIVLNFTEVEYINSTGLALIVGLLAKARKTKRDLKVYGLSPHYAELFQITRLSDFMSVYPDETSALSISQTTA